MNNIVNLQTQRKARLQTLAQGVSLCQTGFHKPVLRQPNGWQPVAEQRFDVRLGKLMHTECCQRCNEERTLLV